MTQHKARPTTYNGITYRSRIEARWAAFFDHLNIRFSYEPKAFDLGALGWYLPDFYLPQQAFWIEVKARDPEPIELEKLSGVTQQRREIGLLLGGPCDWRGKVWATLAGDDTASIAHPVRLCSGLFIHENKESTCKNPLCLMFPNESLAGCMSCRMAITGDDIKACVDDDYYARFAGIEPFKPLVKAWRKSAESVFWAAYDNK